MTAMFALEIEGCMTIGVPLPRACQPHVVLLYLHVQNLGGGGAGMFGWSRATHSYLLANSPFQPFDEVHSLGGHDVTKFFFFFFLIAPREYTEHGARARVHQPPDHSLGFDNRDHFCLDTSSHVRLMRANNYGSSETYFNPWPPCALCQKKNSSYALPSTAQVPKASFIVR